MNNDCLTEKYSGVTLTQLQLNPTGADDVAPSDQCLPCTLAAPQTTDSDSAATYCDPTKKFFGFDFTADPAVTPAAVKNDGTTSSLFFKIGSCGTSTFTLSADGTTADFTTSIGKPASLGTDGIVTAPTLLATDITCSYPSTISGLPMDPGMTVVADAAADNDK